MPAEFDADAKEAALRSESESWNTSNVADALDGDIPVIDVSAYLASGSETDLAAIAAELSVACEAVGFWQLLE